MVTASSPSSDLQWNFCSVPQASITTLRTGRTIYCIETIESIVNINELIQMCPFGKINMKCVALTDNSLITGFLVNIALSADS